MPRDLVQATTIMETWPGEPSQGGSRSALFEMARTPLEASSRIWQGELISCMCSVRKGFTLLCHYFQCLSCEKYFLCTPFQLTAGVLVLPNTINASYIQPYDTVASHALSPTYKCREDSPGWTQLGTASMLGLLARDGAKEPFRTSMAYKFEWFGSVQA